MAIGELFAQDPDVPQCRPSRQTDVSQNDVGPLSAYFAIASSIERKLPTHKSRWYR